MVTINVAAIPYSIREFVAHMLGKRGEPGAGLLERIPRALGAFLNPGESISEENRRRAEQTFEPYYQAFQDILKSQDPHKFLKAKAVMIKAREALEPYLGEDAAKTRTDPLMEIATAAQDAFANLASAVVQKYPGRSIVGIAPTIPLPAKEGDIGEIMKTLLPTTKAPSFSTITTTAGTTVSSPAGTFIISPPGIAPAILPEDPLPVARQKLDEILRLHAEGAASDREVQDATEAYRLKYYLEKGFPVGKTEAGLPVHPSTITYGGITMRARTPWEKEQQDFDRKMRRLNSLVQAQNAARPPGNLPIEADPEAQRRVNFYQNLIEQTVRDVFGVKSNAEADLVKSITSKFINLLSGGMSEEEAKGTIKDTLGLASLGGGPVPQADALIDRATRTAKLAKEYTARLKARGMSDQEIATMLTNSLGISEEAASRLATMAEEESPKTGLLGILGSRKGVVLPPWP